MVLKFGAVQGAMGSSEGVHVLLALLVVLVGPCQSACTWSGSKMDGERSEGTRQCVRNKCREGDRCTNGRENRQKPESQSRMTGRSIGVTGSQGKARKQR